MVAFFELFDSVPSSLTNIIWWLLFLVFIASLFMMAIKLYQQRSERINETEKATSKSELVFFALTPPATQTPAKQNATAFLHEIAKKTTLFSQYKTLSFELKLFRDELKVFIAIAEESSVDLKQQLERYYPGIVIEPCSDPLPHDNEMSYASYSFLEVNNPFLSLHDGIDSEENSLYAILDDIEDIMTEREYFYVQCLFSVCSPSKWRNLLEKEIINIKNPSTKKTLLQEAVSLLFDSIKELFMLFIITPFSQGDSSKRTQTSSSSTHKEKDLLLEEQEQIRLLEKKGSNEVLFDCSLRIVSVCFDNTLSSILLQKIEEYFTSLLALSRDTVTFSSCRTSKERELFALYLRLRSLDSFIDTGQTLLFTPVELSNIIYLPTNEILEKIKVTPHTVAKILPPNLLRYHENTKLISLGTITEEDSATSQQFGIPLDAIAKGFCIIGHEQETIAKYYRSLIHQILSYDKTLLILFDRGEIDPNDLHEIAEKLGKKIAFLDCTETENSDDVFSHLAINPFFNSPFPDIVKSLYTDFFDSLFDRKLGPLRQVLLDYLFETLLLSSSSLYDIPLLLRDQDHRHNILQKINNERVLSFWNNDFSKISSMVKEDIGEYFSHDENGFLPWRRTQLMLSQREESSAVYASSENYYDCMVIHSSGNAIDFFEEQLLFTTLLIAFAQEWVRKTSEQSRKHSSVYWGIPEVELFPSTLPLLLRTLDETRSSTLLSTTRSFSKLSPEWVSYWEETKPNRVIFSLQEADSKALCSKESERFSIELLTSLGQQDMLAELYFTSERSRPFLAML